jgi:hypothetical protein
MCTGIHHLQQISSKDNDDTLNYELIEAMNKHLIDYWKACPCE